jgi:hypothetical protein
MGMLGLLQWEPERISPPVLLVAHYLMDEYPPRVLYAGNQVPADEVTHLLENVAQIEVTDHVRPRVEVEDVALPPSTPFDLLREHYRMRPVRRQQRAAEPGSGHPQQSG